MTHLEIESAGVAAQARQLAKDVGKLHQALLEIDVDDFYGEDKLWREHLQRPETIEFIRLYYAIPDPKIRRQFLEMAKTVAESFQEQA